MTDCRTEIPVSAVRLRPWAHSPPGGSLTMPSERFVAFGYSPELDLPPEQIVPLNASGTGSPIVLFAELVIATPPPPLPRAAVPSAVVPIKLPASKVPLAEAVI